MNRGKWYLVYTHTDEMERSGIANAKVTLNATNENDAVAEARMKLDELIANATAQWKDWEEEKKASENTILHPLGKPRNPQIVYKFSLQ